MKKLLLAALLLASSSAGAEWYVGADLLAYSSLDLDAPEPTALHSVSSDRTSHADNFGYGADIGYQWDSGWYTEISGTDMTTDAKRIESGQDGDFFSRTRTKSEYDLTRISMIVGKAFHLVGAVDLYVEGGASIYEEETKTTSILEEENLLTGTNTSTITASSKISYDGTTYAIGGGFHAGNEHLRSEIGLRYYAEPDETVGTIGFGVLF